MVAYLKPEELKPSLDALVKHYVQVSIETGELPRDFVELIKHNFFAKYAFYDQKRGLIEIGVNENKAAVSPYPPLSVYSFSIYDTEWLSNSFRPGDFHLQYYQGLLGRSSRSGGRDVVMIR